MIRSFILYNNEKFYDNIHLFIFCSNQNQYLLTKISKTQAYPCTYDYGGVGGVLWVANTHTLIFMRDDISPVLLIYIF